MKKGIIIALIVLVIAGIAAYFILKKKKETALTTDATKATVADSVKGAMGTLFAYTPTDNVSMLSEMNG